MTDKNQPLPSLAPERDQVRAYKTTRTESKARKSSSGNSSGGGSTFSTIMIFILIVLLGVGGWWFDMQTKTLQSQIASAEARIQELEGLLSATGEEMGESTVVIKARLTDLTEKTEELWKQMDKLWASAWRKNQAEIKDLQTQQSQQSKTISSLSTQNKSTTDAIQSISNKQTETDFNLGILSEQMQATKNIAGQLDTLKQKISELETSGMGKDQQQIEIAGNIADLQRQVNLIKQRLDSMAATTTVP